MLEDLIKAAVRAGALARYKVELEEGEFDERQLWIRPEIAQLLNSTKLDQIQRARVIAALKRFVVGEWFTGVTKDCRHREVTTIGDIRELKGFAPPFLELRSKPPKHDLRFFGRCIGKDMLILTSHGMKNLAGGTNARPLSVQEHCKRCEDFFKAYGFDRKWTPSTSSDSFSKVEWI
jgi:hypothetical protein